MKRFFPIVGLLWMATFARPLLAEVPTPETGTQIVQNAATNLPAIGGDVKVGSRPTPEFDLEVEVDFVAFDKKEIEALSRHKPLTLSVMRELYQSGKGELLAAPIIRTKSGMNAETKAVLEVIYPTEFEYAEPTMPLTTNNDQTAITTNSLVVPTDFETRDVGVILNVTPVVESGGRTATLTLLPHMVFPPTWKEYGNPAFITNGLKGSVRMEQPIFTSIYAASILSMRINSTALLSGGMTMPDGGKMIFLFVHLRRADMEEDTPPTGD